MQQSGSSGRFRDFIVVLLTFSLISLSFSTGCGSPDGKTNSKTVSEFGPKEKTPFTFDYKTDDKTIKYFTENDSVITLLASTPFYAGNQPLPSQKTGEYDKARAKKVKEIMGDADKLVAASAAVKPELEKVRLAYLAFLTTILKQEPKLESITKDMFTIISLNKSKEQIMESEYKSLKNVKTNNKYAKSLADYLSVTKSVQLGSLYLQDVNNIGMYAAITLEALKESKDPVILEANKKLDKDMKMLDGLKKNLAVIITSIEKIDYGFKQLETGDYYMALAANNFMGSKMKDLEAKVKTIKPSASFTAENIKFTQEYLAFFKKAQVSYGDYLESVDKKTLIPVKKPNAFNPSGIQCAYAAEDGKDYGNAFVSVATPSEPPAPTFTDYFKKGWNGIKTAAQGAQTGIGVGIDTLGTAVRNISRVGCGIYYGNKTADIWKDMKKNSQEIIDNFNKNKSGSETLETAGEYLEGVEKGAGEAAEGAVEKTIGKGWTSWAAGGIIKTTAGMFTDLGKGIYKVSNRNSSAGKLAEGVLDIGLSVIGGSKVVLKGSQVPGLLKGLAQEGKLLGKEGINLVKATLNKMDKKALSKEMAELLTKSKLTQAEAEALIKASIEYETKEAVSATLKAIRADLVKQMQQIMKEGGEKALKSSSEGIKQSLDDLLKESFQNNIKGFMNAINKVTGETGGEYMDNLISEWVDDFIKDAIKDVVDGAPTYEEVSGTWSGSYTITQILLDSSQAKAQGCDYSQLEKLKGRTSSLSLNLSVGVSGTGTSDIESEIGGKGTKAPAKYTGGHVVVDKNQNGMQLHLEGDATRTDTGYAIDGPVTASIKGVPLFKGTWHVIKSR